MDDKGFTLTEMIATLAIIVIISVTVISYIGNTLSINKEEAYKIMKSNIVSVSYDYIAECDNQFIECDYQWENNQAVFNASVLKDSGYIKNLNSPIDDNDLSNCLVVKATRFNGVITVTLEDNCY